MLLPALILLGIGLLLYGPSLWASQILKRHSIERSDFPHTGEALARLLLDQQGLSHVAVEVHFQPPVIRPSKSLECPPEHRPGSIHVVAVLSNARKDLQAQCSSPVVAFGFEERECRSGLPVRSGTVPQNEKVHRCQ
ncbi:MAG: zinc metallopeptidase, partial [Gammaproteobacteria bacterium]|nr:zinc metallopeptidase [Gammaproteobacteria bacterium]